MIGWMLVGAWLRGGRHCHTCAAATQRRAEKAQRELLIDPARQAQRRARGQHPRGVPLRLRVVPMVMLVFGAAVFMLGVQILPWGLLLWPVGLWISCSGMGIRERRIREADAFYERSAAYEERQNIGHWQ